MMKEIRNIKQREKEAVNMSYILQTNHLTKKIDGKELVRDVGIHVKKGEIYGFLGLRLQRRKFQSNCF